MKRISLFQVSFKEGVNAEQLGQKLLAHPYSEESGLGFLVDQIDSEKIVGRFYYRIRVDLHTIDPNGKSIRQEAIKFFEYRFEINMIRSILILSDPPRSLKIFFSKLSQYLGPRISIEPLEIKVGDMLQDFSHIIKFNKLIVGGLRWEPEFTISGELLIESSQLSNLFGKIDSSKVIAIEGSINDTHGGILRCRISSSGTIAFSRNYNGSFLQEAKSLLAMTRR